MTTLYLSPRYTDDSQKLWKAAIKLDWDVQRLSWSEMEKAFGPGVVAPIVYGETIFTSMASERLNLKLYDPPSTFLMDLQRRYEMNLHLEEKLGPCPFNFRVPVDFLSRKVYNYRYYDPPEVNDGRIYLGRYSVYPANQLFNPHDPPKDFLETPKFVKPVEKGLFVGKVYPDPIKQIQTLPHNTEVIVSEPVEWDIEFRAFIFDRQVKTISPYSRKGELVEQATAQEWEEGEAFANKVAKLYKEPFVVDVGYMTHPVSGKSGWAVVEANGAWGSGVYGCDPIEALKVIKEACNV